jgi:hypothetical protein
VDRRSGAVHYTTEIERIPEELRGAKSSCRSAAHGADRPAAAQLPAPAPAPAAAAPSAAPPP